jgi:hypothetical protein
MTDSEELTQTSRIILRNLIIAKVAKRFLTFMEPEGSLLYLYELSLLENIEARLIQ